MTVKVPTAPRQLKPELEHEFVRSPDLVKEDFAWARSKFSDFLAI